MLVVSMFFAQMALLFINYAYLCSGIRVSEADVNIQQILCKILET